MNGQFYDSSEAEDFYPFGIEDTEDDYDDYGDYEDYDDSEDYEDIGDDYMGMEGGDDSEDLDYPESEAAESRRSRRRARVRRYRARLARARFARARARARFRRRRPSRPPARSKRPASKRHVQHVANKAQRNRSAIRNVDLQNKVKTDMLARGLSAQGKRIDGNEYAETASKVVDQLKETFPDLKNNKAIDTVLNFGTLFFLDPRKKGSGFQSVFSDPRVVGAALIGGLALFNEFRDKDEDAQEVTIMPPVQVLAAGANAPFSAVARDRSRKKIEDRTFKWYSSNPAVATVNIDTGVVSIPAEAVAGTEAEILAVETGTERRASAKVRVSK